MRAVAIVAGKGGWHRHAAERFARRWNRLTSYIPDGFPCIDASDTMPWARVHHVMFIKAFVWDVVPADTDVVLWFDTDCFQTRAIATSEIPTAAFSAVRDNQHTITGIREKWLPAKEVVDFFNGGVFIASRAAMPVFDDLKKWTDEKQPPGPHGDQEPLNLLVARHLADFTANPTGWNALPNAWNFIIGREPAPRPIILHFAGSWGREVLLDLLYLAAEETERAILTRNNPASR